MSGREGFPEQRHHSSVMESAAVAAGAGNEFSMELNPRRRYVLSARPTAAYSGGGVEIQLRGATGAAASPVIHWDPRSGDFDFTPAGMGGGANDVSATTGAQKFVHVAAVTSGFSITLRQVVGLQ